MITRHIVIVYIRSVKDLFFLCLLICGDVHSCPGPVHKTPQFPCVSCGRAVRHNGIAILCDSCKNWIPLTSPLQTIVNFNSLMTIYFYKQCLLFELPLIMTLT